MDWIVSRVTASKNFTVIADETTDISRTEQVPSFVLYWDITEVREEFNTKVTTLADLILTWITLAELGDACLVEQSYAGAPTWCCLDVPPASASCKSCASDCSAYLVGTLRSEFIIALMSMKHVLAATKPTSVTLQGSAPEFPEAVEHIKNLRFLFQQWRDSECSGCYQRIHNYTVKIGDVHLEGRRDRPPTTTSAYIKSFPSDFLPAFHRLLTVRLTGKVLGGCRVLIQSVQAPSSLDFGQRCN